MLAESIAIEREAGDRLGLAGNLEVFARLADAQGRPARAARLNACASVLRESVGFDAFEVGWPDPDAARRPPPWRTRRGRIRRGVGAGMRDDVG